MSVRDDEPRGDRLHELMRELDGRVTEARRLRERIAAATARIRARRRNDNSDSGNPPVDAH